MSIYKLETEVGSYLPKEAAAMLMAKWIQQGIKTTGKVDIEVLDTRNFMQKAIRDAVIVELGKFMQTSGLSQDFQNEAFKELFDDS
jgi:hypothetical protein